MIKLNEEEMVKGLAKYGIDNSEVNKIAVDMAANRQIGYDQLAVFHIVVDKELKKGQLNGKPYNPLREDVLLKLYFLEALHGSIRYDLRKAVTDTNQFKLSFDLGLIVNEIPEFVHACSMYHKLSARNASMIGIIENGESDLDSLLEDKDMYKKEITKLEEVK